MGNDEQNKIWSEVRLLHVIKCCNLTKQFLLLHTIYNDSRVEVSNISVQPN